MPAPGLDPGGRTHRKTPGSSGEGHGLVESPGPCGDRRLYGVPTPAAPEVGRHGRGVAIGLAIVPGPVHAPVLGEGEPQVGADALGRTHEIGCYHAHDRVGLAVEDDGLVDGVLGFSVTEGRVCVGEHYGRLGPGPVVGRRKAPSGSGRSTQELESSSRDGLGSSHLRQVVVSDAGREPGRHTLDPFELK